MTVRPLCKDFYDTVEFAAKTQGALFVEIGEYLENRFAPDFITVESINLSFGVDGELPHRAVVTLVS